MHVDLAAIDPEVEALNRLWAKAQEAAVAQSAKLTALVETLRQIGVGPDVRRPGGHLL